MQTRPPFSRISLALHAAHYVAAVALASATVACGSAASDDAGDESAGALATASGQDASEAEAFRHRIELCKAESDASRRRACFQKEVDKEVYFINLMDTIAHGVFANTSAKCTRKPDFSNPCYGQTTQIFDNVRQYRTYEDQLCNVKAALPSQEASGQAPADTSVIQACRADRELDLANTFLQIFYDDPMVKTDTALAKACPRPEFKIPTFSSKIPEFEAQISDWEGCLKSTFFTANAAKVKRDVLSPIADATVAACWGPANGAERVEEVWTIKTADCWAVSLTLLQQTIDKKY